MTTDALKTIGLMALFILLATGLLYIIGLLNSPAYTINLGPQGPGYSLVRGK